MSKTKFHLATDDFYRVLLSDIQPYHMPLIFNNEGFYKAVKTNDRFRDIAKDLPDDDFRRFNLKNKPTIPYIYFINKDSSSLRELSLIHPFQQLEFVDFYQEYQSLILYYCNKSRFSLRYPAKKNSTVYRPRNKNTYEKLINEYKTDNPDLVNDDKELKYASTYFSYRKYDFNYKFYESAEFIKLERKYPYLKMLDVSRCFDSIYTHSVSWAVRDKDYIKENHGRQNTSFDEAFDKLMQNSNYQETNGILIGSEIARIFAEIIFQDIDERILLELSKRGIRNNQDYTIKRYVDDFCIFSKDKASLDVIADVIASELKVYNLYINNLKTKDYSRPFITNRSKNIIQLRRLLKQEMSHILEKITPAEQTDSYYLPNKSSLTNPLRLATYFIKDLKSYWHVEGEFETGFSNYLMKTLNEQVLMFIKKFNKNHINADDQNTIINYFIFIFELALYAFSLEPKVTPSFSFSRLILVITKFSKLELTDYHEKLAHRVHTGLIDLLNNELSNESACIVEKLNILLTLNEVGEYYLPNENELKQYIFSENETHTGYFSLITGLFIISHKKEYSNLKAFIIEEIKSRLRQLPGAKKSSEAMHLYMDSMSCPYIDLNDKKEITKIVIKDFVSENRQSHLIDEYLDFFSCNQWFVNWNELDILSKLLRKQLRRAY